MEALPTREMIAINPIASEAAGRMAEVGFS